MIPTLGQRLSYVFAAGPVVWWCCVRPLPLEPLRCALALAQRRCCLDRSDEVRAVLLVIDGGPDESERSVQARSVPAHPTAPTSPYLWQCRTHQGQGDGGPTKGSEDFGGRVCPHLTFLQRKPVLVCMEILDVICCNSYIMARLKISKGANVNAKGSEGHTGRGAGEDHWQHFPWLLRLVEAVEAVLDRR